MSIKKGTEAAWSLIWLVVALCIVIPIAWAVLEPFVTIIAFLVIGGVGLFIANRIRKALMHGKQFRG